MSFSRQELAMRSGELFAQAVAVACRHDAVPPAVPQMDVRGDVLNAKAPRSGQYQELIHVAWRTDSASEHAMASRTSVLASASQSGSARLRATRRRKERGNHLSVTAGRS